MDLQPLAWQRLTRRFFMQLPAGVYLASNVSFEPGRPIFGELVAPLAERGAQWLRIREHRVDQQTCEVHATADDYANSKADSRSRWLSQRGH